MKPYFSVIVPVYKAEPWLRQCVDSILGQTFSDLELILADDGSPDGCPAICDEYAARDSRVKVLHLANGGPAKARKAGLSLASADYVSFVDSDDWLTGRCLAVVRDRIESNGRPDMIFFDHTRDAGPTEYPSFLSPGLYDKARMESQLYPYMLCDLRRRPFGTQLVPAFLCTKVCRRELLLAHYIEDGTPVMIFEDLAMAYECMYHASSIYVCDEPLYVYRRTENSLLTGYRSQFFQEVQICFQYVRRRLGGIDPGLDTQINAAYLRKVLVGVVNELNHASGLTEAAGRIKARLDQTGLVRELSYRGLPWDMRAYLLLLKCRLYLPAVFVTKLRL